MAKRPNLFEVDSMGRTVLINLAAKGDFAAVRRIIYSLPGTGFSCPRYVLIGHTDNTGKTAIDAAREGGHQAIAKLLSYELSRMEWFE